MGRNKTIDYLKTFAIVAVFLYHLGLVANGYLGVEIFFVASGFLMMKKINQCLDDGTYLPISYLLGRIASLWPLAAVSGLIALVAGYFCMLPDDYENLSQSVIATDFFANNILEAITTKDYWNIVNTYKPLMHTWYVGLLIQMLVLLSFLVWAMSKISHRAMVRTLIVVTVLSFMAFCLPTVSDAEKFYYLPYRLFELTIGCLVVYFPKSRLSQRINILAGNLGILIILGTMFTCIDVPVPIGMIIVLVSTCIVIWSHGSADYDHSLSDRIYDIVTLAGRYSYDIYIWHQVIIAFLLYSLYQELNAVMVCVTVVFTAAASFCSATIRKRLIILNETRGRMIFALIAVVISCVAATYIYVHAGVVRDVPELELKTSNAHRHMHSEYCDTPFSWDMDFDDPDRIHVLVLGDSFGRDFANILNESEYAEQLEISYIYGTNISEEQDRIEDADFVFYGANNWGIPDELEGIDKDKFYRVGNKRFGNSNGIIYINRDKEWYHDQYAKVSDDMISNNDAMASLYGDHYIDMITPMMKGNYIRVFTDDGYFISQDCAHLTKRGAQYYSRVLKLDFLLEQ